MNQPRLTLRLGFAGRKDLTPDGAHNLRIALTQAYASIGAALVRVRADGQSNSHSVPSICGVAPPMLRLVTGLCEGADALATTFLNEVTPAKPEPAFATELTAVLPFSVVDYRTCRPTASNLPTATDADKAKAQAVLDQISFE